jgi:pyridoxine 5'-phosphate synthase PdxJ
MNAVTTEAFTSELEKIAQRYPATKERLKTTAKAMGIFALGYGLGSGLGRVAGHQITKSALPGLTNADLKKVSVGVGLLSGAGALGMAASKSQLRNLWKEADKVTDSRFSKAGK